MSVYGRRCVRPGCRGTAQVEYSDVELYNQLRYFAMLFDGDKAKSAALGTARFGTPWFHLFLVSHEMFIDEVRGLASTNLTFLLDMGATVNKYIDQCGRRWVNLAALFQ